MGPTCRCQREAGEREGGWRRVLGRLGRVAALGCGAVDQAGKDRGRLRTFADWAQSRTGPKAGRVKVKAYLFIKGTNK
jgi:hypothetical protein